MNITTIPLLALALLIPCTTGYAAELLNESTLGYITSPAATLSPTPNDYDNLTATLTIYGLVIGIYALYWYRQQT